jgi:hypothetical protein
LLLAAAVAADQVKAAAARVVRLGTVTVSQQAQVDKIDAQLALMVGWSAGSPLQVAAFNEATTQRAVVVADMAAVAAEVVRLTP